MFRLFENAVLNWCKKRGINAKQVMAFGDDWNDIGLFKECGYPIAMSITIFELEELAIEVTNSNKQDSVAHILEQIRNEPYGTVTKASDSISG